MEKMIFLCYWIVLVSLFGIYVINRCIIKRTSNKIEEKTSRISYNELEKRCVQYLKKNNINNVRLEFSQNYCFDLKNNSLKIVKKQEYTKYDIFICYHEIGHIIDFNNRYNRIYKLIAKAKTVFYILWIPILCISLSMIFENLQVQSIVFALNLLEIGAGVLIIGTSGFIEYNASKCAISNFEFVNNEEKLELSKVAKLCACEQTIYWAIAILPLFFILYIIVLGH